MNLELRTFSIRDAATEEDEQQIAGFLRTVEVERIDTAYADGGWRVLVHYRDLRRREEQAQIESAIQAALNNWRGDVARSQGISRDEVLSNTLLAEVARFAPTTEVELSVIASSLGESTHKHGAAIVAVVRQTGRPFLFGPGTDQTSSRMRSGFSIHSLTRTRKVTASRPSMMRWS